LDDSGYIITNESMHTSISGIFAAGDVRSKAIRQVTTATSDGTIAALEAIKYVLKKENLKAQYN
ncbi:MAG: NAD(P)/FAD-dependent oxidoreductase, partial [Cetobacterium sp.]